MAAIQVQQGDTLSVLAKKYNTTVEELMKLNPSIKDKHTIYKGQMITVPDAKAPTADEAEVKTEPEDKAEGPAPKLPVYPNAAAAARASNYYEKVYNQLINSPNPDDKATADNALIQWRHAHEAWVQLSKTEGSSGSGGTDTNRVRAGRGNRYWEYMDQNGPKQTMPTDDELESSDRTQAFQQQFGKKDWVGNYRNSSTYTDKSGNDWFYDPTKKEWVKSFDKAQLVAGLGANEEYQIYLQNEKAKWEKLHPGKPFDTRGKEAGFIQQKRKAARSGKVTAADYRPDTSQQQSIFYLYKKLVDPNADPGTDADKVSAWSETDEGKVAIKADEDRAAQEWADRVNTGYGAAKSKFKIFEDGTTGREWADQFKASGRNRLTSDPSDRRVKTIKPSSELVNAALRKY